MSRRIDPAHMHWTREPEHYSISPGSIEIVTAPHTDLWQQTYYNFQNDSAPVLQLETDERFFSFVVKTHFDSHHRFDQCGVVVYIDSKNWLKASVEYENEQFQRLGSVVTNHGFSDWASSDIDAGIKTMWYRLSRRDNDFRIEVSAEGQVYHQIRVCHLYRATARVPFGIYACSPEDSSFRAVFSDMMAMECAWPPHDGQAPDPGR